MGYLLRVKFRFVFNVCGRAAIWALAVTVLAAAPEMAAAQPLPVAGDAGHLWVVRPGPTGEAASGEAGGSGGAGTPGETLTVLHRGQVDEAGRIVPARTLRGRLRPGGIAAGGDQVWLAYVDGTVQRLRASPSPIEPGWTFSARIVASLPSAAPTAAPAGESEAALRGGGELRAFAANVDGPWALMRMSAGAVTAPDATGKEQSPPIGEQDLLRSISMGLPPGHLPWDSRQQPEADDEAEAAPPRATTGDEPADGDEETADGTSDEGDDRPVITAAPTPAPRTQPASTAAADTDALAAPRDHLLHLQGGRWTAVPLPEDWPDGAPAAMAIARGDRRPTLLVANPGAAGELWVYQWNADEHRWRQTSYDLSLIQGAGIGEAMIVQGQLVLVRRPPQAEPVHVEAVALRGGQVQPIGDLGIDAPRSSAWGAAPMGLTLALVVQSPTASAAEGGERGELNLRWMRIDLTGAVVQAPEALSPREPGVWGNAADYAIMAAIAFLSVLMLTVFWRRDPSKHQLALPPQWMLADLPRRALAGAIDLAPGAILVLWLYDLGVMELVQYRWPGNVPSFEGTLPGAVVIGIFVAHTTLTELITGRTMGKALLGLRVTDLQGGRPAWWQMLVRGSLKAFDLVAWLLLVLPLLGPYRQRLGDLLGRTVVVMAHKEGDAGSNDQPDEADDD